MEGCVYHKLPRKFLGWAGRLELRHMDLKMPLASPNQLTTSKTVWTGLNRDLCVKAASNQLELPNQSFLLN